MTILSTAELYALFLACDWWIELSRRKRVLVGHCERCPAKQGLQSHHKFYRENWFDTITSDLEVLCRDCHEKEHHITNVVFTPNTKAQAAQWRQGNKKRSHKHHGKPFKSRKQRVKERRRKERTQGLYGSSKPSRMRSR